MWPLYKSFEKCVDLWPILTHISQNETSDEFHACLSHFIRNRLQARDYQDDCFGGGYDLGQEEEELDPVYSLILNDLYQDTTYNVQVRAVSKGGREGIFI